MRARSGPWSSARVRRGHTVVALTQDDAGVRAICADPVRHKAFPLRSSLIESVRKAAGIDRQCAVRSAPRFNGESTR
jgi:hypothetical protein